MSITIIETGISTQSGTNPTREQRYTVLGAADTDAAEAALASGTGVTKPADWAGFPTSIGAMAYDSLDVDMRDNSATTFDASVGYRKARNLTPAATNDEEISFDISSQTIRLKQSKETISRTALSGTAPDYKGGIAIDSNGEFQGTDVMVEAFSFSITVYKPIATITNAYIQTLRNAAFHYNTDTFRGLAPGEGLFVGASGSRRNDDDFAIAHKFMGSKNLTGVSIGDITGLSKNGWELLWALYEDEEDAAAKKITARPTAAFRERLYDPINFSATLGITP